MWNACFRNIEIIASERIALKEELINLFPLVLLSFLPDTFIAVPGALFSAVLPSIYQSVEIKKEIRIITCVIYLL